MKKYLFSILGAIVVVLVFLWGCVPFNGNYTATVYTPLDTVSETVIVVEEEGIFNEHEMSAIFIERVGLRAFDIKMDSTLRLLYEDGKWIHKNPNYTLVFTKEK